MFFKVIVSKAIRGQGKQAEIVLHNRTMTCKPSWYAAILI